MGLLIAVRFYRHMLDGQPGPNLWPCKGTTVSTVNTVNSRVSDCQKALLKSHHHDSKASAEVGLLQLRISSTAH
jgi:hypothetical protein